jgi:hypothetical protein
MKITRRQLRRLILKEAIAMNEAGSVNVTAYINNKPYSVEYSIGDKGKVIVNHAKDSSTGKALSRHAFTSTIKKSIINAINKHKGNSYTHFKFPNDMGLIDYFKSLW